MSSGALFTFQDVCGPVYSWPPYIKKIIVSDTFVYRERMKLRTFFYVNGLRDPGEWLKFIIGVKGVAFRRYDREIISLFNYYGNTSVQNRYFSYCMQHKRYEYLNGAEKRV